LKGDGKNAVWVTSIAKRQAVPKGIKSKGAGAEETVTWRPMGDSSKWEKKFDGPKSEGQNKQGSPVKNHDHRGRRKRRGTGPIKKNKRHSQGEGVTKRGFLGKAQERDSLI